MARPKKGATAPEMSENLEVLNEYSIPGADVEALLNSVEDLDASVAEVPFKPLPKDAEWQDYVLDMLWHDEVVYNEKTGVRKPRTAGLSRVFEIVMGPIVSAVAKVIESGPERAVVEYTIVFKKDLEGRDNGECVTFCDAYEVNNKNTDPKFVNYAVPSACTVAEGRVYKKALKLRCYTAEEIDPAPESAKKNGRDRAAPEQVGTISLLIKRCNLDRIKYLDRLNGYYGKKWGDFEDVSAEAADEVIKNLNKYIQGTKEIPVDCQIVS